MAKPDQYADYVVNDILEGWINAYPNRFWYRQDKYYLEIWVEKDTMVLLLEQLVAKVLGPDMIPVNSTSGFDGRSHFMKQIKRLKKHEKLGRKIIIFYLGDYDPSGLSIQKNLEDMLEEEGLTNFEFKRIGITLEQIQRLHLYEVVDPAKLRALQNDSRGAKFEWEHGRRFAVEVDTMSSDRGLKELKRLIKQIFRDYWDENTSKICSNI